MKKQIIIIATNERLISALSLVFVRQLFIAHAVKQCITTRRITKRKQYTIRMTTLPMS